MNMPGRNWFIALFTLIALHVMVGVQAIETKLSGHMEAQIRWFPSSPPVFLPALGRQQSNGVDVSVALRPEWKYLTENRKHDFKVTPFVRYDSLDEERTHVDIRELYWLYKGDYWEILAGVDQVFWGVTESRHLVDIINQTDLVEDPDEEDKLGQPMIRLSLDLGAALTLDRKLKPKKAKRNWGKLSLFLMPGFRERTFPGKEGRLRPLLPVEDKFARFPGGASKDRVDLALRYSHTIGKWDLGLHYFHGNSREPRLIQNGFTVVPQYDLINQAGIDVQYTSGAWLGKFEGIVREGEGPVFGALVAGVEYTWYQVFDSAMDIGFLVEYLHDERDKVLAPGTLFDNDIFVGSRFSFNDVKNTQILIGAAIDRLSDEYFFSLEAERRISNNISAEIRARAFGGAESMNDAIYSFEKDDYVQFSVFYHF
uniref:Uncharacterized protein n=1 Tax=Candidatus Kentrum sp. MB TaxID=2138164 RepID=A0A450XZK2_9GAMM|nr:MAG: hypothetical protein BECKMB1821I_GA0114274_10807 [Candidatus Kentron sp. MB]VFK76903.1 MAG: hypothetical protein BECKMB1821H_GA0114242_10827 [Candidatus Kentron sp. MB]